MIMAQMALKIPILITPIYIIQFTLIAMRMLMIKTHERTSRTDSGTATMQGGK